MRRISKLQQCLLLCSLVLATVCMAEAVPYDYPFDDPYEATILGTPEAEMASLPKKIRIKKQEMTVFPERQVPDVFWYNKKLLYSVACQKEKAPLIFMIAGTGAGYDSAKMQMMQKAFFQAGWVPSSRTVPKMRPGSPLWSRCATIRQSPMTPTSRSTTVTTGTGSMTGICIQRAPSIS